MLGVQVPHLVDPERATMHPISPADIEVFPHHLWLLIPIFTKQNFYGFLSINNAGSDTKMGTDAYVVFSVVWKIAQALERNQTLRTLRKSKAELRRLTSRIIDVQKEYRQKISAEIHDTIIQKMTCIWLKLQFFEKRHPFHVKEFGSDFEFLKADTDQSIQEARRTVSGLRPPGLDELGIERAVEGYVKLFQEQNPIRVDLSFEGDYSSLSAEKQINVFRIIQEAMENVGKHSHAAYARVALRCVNDRCFFLVEDSGNRIKVGSIGEPLPFCDVKVVDDYDVELPARISGEIVVRTKGPDAIFIGYYKDSQRTQESMRDGWFHSGDRRCYGRFLRRGGTDPVPDRRGAQALRTSHRRLRDPHDLRGLSPTSWPGGGKTDSESPLRSDPQSGGFPHQNVSSVSIFGRHSH